MTYISISVKVLKVIQEYSEDNKCASLEVRLLLKCKRSATLLSRERVSIDGIKANLTRLVRRKLMG